MSSVGWAEVATGPAIGAASGATEPSDAKGSTASSPRSCLAAADIAAADL